MLQAALARGHGRGKPVLVLRVPEQDRVERGEMLGALLHGASRALLEALPLAELVCARRTDLAALRPGWRLEREPLAWLVEARGADPRARAIDPALEEAPGSARLAPLDGTLVGALVGDEALVHQRAAAVNAAGTFRVPARTRLLAEPLEASFEDVDKGAALLFRASLGADPDASPHRAMLRAHTRARLLDAPTSGARWAARVGVGVDTTPQPEQRSPEPVDGFQS